MFQSPQWGDCSKVQAERVEVAEEQFQSPQWGDCSKGGWSELVRQLKYGFSPRNVEIVLKGESREIAL